MSVWCLCHVKVKPLIMLLDKDVADFDSPGTVWMPSLVRVFIVLTLYGCPVLSECSLLTMHSIFTLNIQKQQLTAHILKIEQVYLTFVDFLKTY